jgi:hypothetical protein
MDYLPFFSKCNLENFKLFLNELRKRIYYTRFFWKSRSFSLSYITESSKQTDTAELFL